MDFAVKESNVLDKKERDVESKPVYNFLKRCFDVVLSAVALIVLSPIFALAAVAIKLEDGGEVIYTQKRVTCGGKTFTMYKFRSMCVDAERKQSGLLSKNEMTGPVFKIKNDPRITKVGRVLRRASIDELPQLINVLRGDMSIIGPRPPLPQEVVQYTEYQWQRLYVKAGLACYRECRGRNRIKDFDRWVEMDLEYIRDRCLWVDFKILIRTIVAVILGIGAE